MLRLTAPLRRARLAAGRPVAYTARSMSDVIEDITTQEQLEAIMTPEGPAAIIDFWAAWCGPCRMMAPHFEAVAEAMKDGPVKFYKLDTEKQPRLAAAFNVRALPTLLLIYKGEIRDALVGARPPHEIQKKAEWLEKKASGRGLLGRLFS